MKKQLRVLNILIGVVVVLMMPLWGSYYEAYYEQQRDGVERYYFNSYEEMTNFFMDLTPKNATFAQGKTVFYADVYQTQIMNDVVRGFMYKSDYQTCYGMIKLSLDETRKLEKKWRIEQRYPIENRHENKQENKEKPIWLQWKIVEKSIKQEMNARVLTSKGPDYYTFWDALKSKNFDFNVSIDPTSNMITFSFGGTNPTAEFLRERDASWRSHEASNQYYQNLLYSRPWIFVQRLKKVHYDRLVYVLDRIKHKHPQFASKVHELLSKMPPVPDENEYELAKIHFVQALTGKFDSNNYYDCVAAEKYGSVVYKRRINRWFYDELCMLNSKLSKVYWGNIERAVRSLVYCVSEGLMMRFADDYVKEVDRILEKYYTYFPSQKKPPLIAIGLSHPVTPQLSLSNRDKLISLQEKWEKQAEGDEPTQKRALQRMNALAAAVEKDAEPHDYSGMLSAHQPFTDPDAVLFENCYGSALDYQLHEELCQIRTQIYDLQSALPHDRHVQAYVPLINATTAQAKSENCPERAYNLADFSHNLVNLVTSGVDYLLTQAEKLMVNHSPMLQDAYECEMLEHEGQARAVQALATGVVEGVKEFVDPQRYVAMVEGVKDLAAFVVRSYVQTAEGDDPFLTACITGETQPLEEHMKRLETHCAQTAQQLEESIKSVYAQLSDMSAEDFLRNGARLGTTCLLDMTALKAAELMSTVEGRAFVKDACKVFTLPPAQAEECLLEVAGVGKIALEEGVDEALHLLKYAPEAERTSLTKKITSDRLMKQTGNVAHNSFKDLADRIRKIDKNILDEMEALKGHTLEKHVTKTKQFLIRRGIKEDLKAAATTFPNKATAIKAVQQNLRNNADQVAAWLINKNEGSVKVFEYTHSYKVGEGVYCGKKGGFQPFIRSRVILQKDDAHSLGFIIKTAFPIEE